MGEHFDDDLYEILTDSSLDSQIYRVLTDTTRRYVLYILEEWGRVSMDELADALTGWTYAREYRMATPADRDQLVVDLHQIHVPKLREAGLVAYDEQRAVLTLEDLSPAVERLLEWARENEYPNWSRSQSGE